MSDLGKHYDAAVEDKVQVAQVSFVVGEQIRVKRGAGTDKQMVFDDASSGGAVKCVGNIRYDPQHALAGIVNRLLEIDVLYVDTPNNFSLVRLGLPDGRFIDYGIAPRCRDVLESGQYRPAGKIIIGYYRVSAFLTETEKR